jgi:1,4-dihydroxy-2-naphthoyl-CoA hydrolase
MSAELPPGVRLPSMTLDPSTTFDSLYGLEITEVSDELVRGTIPVRDKIKQPWGLVHGGVFATVAESLASLGTATGILGSGQLAYGLSNNTSFLRPASAGTLHASAQRRHGGRTTWVWDVEVAGDDGRVCAVSRVTIAVRPPPA